MLQNDDSVTVIADGLRQLSQAELRELDEIVTPRVAALFAKAFGPDIYQVLKPLTANDRPDGTPGREDAGLSGGQSGTHPEEKKLREMMRDPRYWRDKDPDYMDRVAAGFGRLYPNGR